jgi:hypothetical protein
MKAEQRDHTIPADEPRRGSVDRTPPRRRREGRATVSFANTATSATNSAASGRQPGESDQRGEKLAGSGVNGSNTANIAA